MGRKRLAKLMDDEDKKRRKYRYCVVVKIMNALLTDKPRKKRKRPTRGRPRQRPWLNDAALRIRVLSEIEARMDSIPVSEQIKSAFLIVIRRHHPNSGKK